MYACMHACMYIYIYICIISRHYIRTSTVSMIFELLHPIMYLQPCLFHFHLGDADALAVHGVSPALGGAFFLMKLSMVRIPSGKLP